MPRVARKKSSESLYHIMCRSISEINLFICDDDKQYYISLIKRYCEKYHASVYAYCIMDNHVHMYLNPMGVDVSTFMHSLNSAYVSYFNRRYNRHGHLFQGRFASNIVTGDAYSLTLSAYIHNNSKDIPGYKGREEEYPYSSYGIYTGFRKNTEGFVDTSFILKQFSGDAVQAREKYKSFVEFMREAGIMKDIDSNIVHAYIQNEYRSEKRYIAREKSPDKVVEKICELLGEGQFHDIRAKYRREKSSLRAFAVYVMRVLCGCTYKKICEIIGNISLSGVVRLNGEGYRLYAEHKRYKEVFGALI
jgi:REP element-mobilizing transposase RayT